MCLPVEFPMIFVIQFVTENVVECPRFCLLKVDGYVVYLPMIFVIQFVTENVVECPRFCLLKVD
jgi:hypothetical protein